MEEILKSTLLQYDKSTFLLDVVKHKTGADYIRLTQTIDDEKDRIIRIIKINKNVLVDVIAVLQNYQAEFDKYAKSHSKSYFSEDKKKSVVERYFKGITIKDLALQFGCTEQIIEQILFNKGIEIVDNKLPKQVRYRKSRRK